MMGLGGSTRPHAIAMWAFCWLERRWPGAGFEDWARALDELVERGYDAVRIDAYPHLLAEGPEATSRLLPIWTEHDWGSPLPVDVQVQPALNEFIGLCAERGVRVGLSSWFRQDTTGARMKIRTAADHAAVWITTLRSIADAGLLDNVFYLDLCNEWPDMDWAPFLYDWSGGEPERLSRTDPIIRDWTKEAFAAIREEFPGIPLCFSASHELASWADQDVSGYDLLEPHLWMAHSGQTGFYPELGYDAGASYFDWRQYAILCDRAPALYAEQRERWQAELVSKVENAAAWSRASGKPLMTTECWAIINWKDGPGLDWGWIKELAELGIATALATGRWTALATSNFCAPQFRGMWDDVAWHQRMTTLIRSAGAA
ncbi:cellulase-like family protein [Streptosporangium sp. NPDC000396]|uniref:cellulase-like family protein n=1 Tax=Streptosporangium sp. NPDC000396 TaxID=3366185 RepID=UPI003690F782